MTGALRATGVSVSYGTQRVLDDVDLTITRGETVGLRGPSGRGKSTLVRVLALLHPPDTGHVDIEGTPVTGVRHRVHPTLRTRIAVLFQSPRTAADPRLRLDQLIAEPLIANRRPGDHTVTVRRLADTVGLTPDLLARRPHAVSDGQLQRACLARALTLEPTWLLCDEATVMLDASTQAHLAHVIRTYQQEHGAGVLIVSHDDTLLNRWAHRTVDF
jgi:ABC-type dipeptide/oligopeptide/nickel transport system ATPase subunit